MVFRGKKTSGGQVMRLNPFCIFFFLSVSICGVYAEDLEPDTPDMELPPMSLELEDLLQEEMETVLPEQQFTPDLDLETELPGPPEIEIPLSVADLDLELQADAENETTAREKSGSVYSNGRIGLGNTNRILGDLAIYKLGPEPHFQMQFIHERFDGYHFRERGSGFFRRFNLISGGISYRPESFLLDADAAFHENNDGLQGVGSYNSVLHRSIGGDVSFRYYPGDVVTLGADFGGMYTQETLSGETPVNGYEVALGPALLGAFLIDPVTISLEWEYAFRFITGVPAALHGVNGTLGVDVTLGENWVFGGSVGIDWHNQKQIQVPFALYLRRGMNEAFDITLRGGYETKLLRYGDLWVENHFYSLSGIYPEISRWFAFADVDWDVLPLLTLTAMADYSHFDRSVYPSTGPEPETGMLLITNTAADLLTFRTGLRWETLDWLSLRSFWKGSFLDVSPLQPSHTVGFTLVLNSQNDVWRGEVQAELPVYSQLQMPLLGFSVTFAPDIGVEFTLSGSDLLSPAMSENRTEWGYYETPGLNIMLAAGISL